MFKVRIAILLIALFVVGIILTFSSVSNLIKLNGDVPDFNYDSMQNIKKGDIVQGYVLNIEGCYAYTTTTNTKYGIETSSYTSDEYFLMPLVNETDGADNMYITIVASKIDDRELLYDISDATWEYYQGNFDVTFPEMGIVAKVNELDSEYEGYLIEAMLEAEYYSTASEVRSHVVPYVLRIYNPKTAYTNLGIGLVIILAFVVVGIIVYSKYKASLAPQTFVPVQETNDFTLESKPSENGFTENYAPPQPVPIPDIPQPVQPDEFFARAPKAAAPIEEVPKEEPAAPVIEEEPKQEPAAAAVSSGIAGSMDELDTTGMFDDADYEFDTDSDGSDFTE